MRARWAERRCSQRWTSQARHGVPSDDLLRALESNVAPDAPLNLSDELQKISSTYGQDAADAVEKYYPQYQAENADRLALHQQYTGTGGELEDVVNHVPRQGVAPAAPLGWTAADTRAGTGGPGALASVKTPDVMHRDDYLMGVHGGNGNTQTRDCRPGPRRTHRQQGQPRHHR